MRSETVTSRMLIDGEFTDSAGSATLDVVDPYTGDVWAEIPRAVPDDVDRAVAAARRAFEHGPWSRSSPGYREGCMRRLADLIEQEADRLGELDTRDNGKLLRETSKQARLAAATYRYYASLTDKIYGSVIPLEDITTFDYVVYEPYGVCALLVAWNSPMQLLANKMAPALAAGNTVVVKPSEHASVSVLQLAKLVQKAGFPPGVVNIVSGLGSEAGAALTAHHDVDLISLTGGPATGRQVLRAASDSLAKVVLELGGKSPQVVFPDADLDAAVNGVLAGVFAATGQTCIAGSRLLVHQDVFEEVVGRVAQRADAVKVGDPMQPDTQMGPLANRLQFDRVAGLVEKGIANGGQLVTNAEYLDKAAGELFIRPVVFTGLDRDATLVREEVFGPVLVALPFTDESEAVALCNDTSGGLAAGVWTNDVTRAIRMAQRLRVGTVWVNTYRKLASAAPFGGVGRSGIGRERGLEGLREYVQSKNVMMATEIRIDDPFTIRT
jgi:acyl-CoA reductase-like NAD-dependent aldehyde dehydrogenase